MPNMGIVEAVLGVTANIGKEEAGGLKRFMISLWPIKNPKPNDRWLNTKDNKWYVWLGTEWVEDAWEGGS